MGLPSIKCVGVTVLGVLLGASCAVAGSAGTTAHYNNGGPIHGSTMSGEHRYGPRQYPLPFAPIAVLGGDYSRNDYTREITYVDRTQYVPVPYALPAFMPPRPEDKRALRFEPVTYVSSRPKIIEVPDVVQFKHPLVLEDRNQIVDGSRLYGGGRFNHSVAIIFLR